MIPTFANGEIGFWMKAEYAKADFADALLEYTPRIPYIQTVASDIKVKKYPEIVCWGWTFMRPVIPGLP